MAERREREGKRGERGRKAGSARLRSRGSACLSKISREETGNRACAGVAAGIFCNYSGFDIQLRKDEQEKKKKIQNQYHD